MSKNNIRTVVIGMIIVTIAATGSYAINMTDRVSTNKGTSPISASHVDNKTSTAAANNPQPDTESTTNASDDLSNSADLASISTSEAMPTPKVTSDPVTSPAVAATQPEVKAPANDAFTPTVPTGDEPVTPAPTIPAPVVSDPIEVTPQPTFSITLLQDEAYLSDSMYQPGTYQLVVPFDIAQDEGFVFSDMSDLGCRITAAPIEDHGVLCNASQKEPGSGFLVIQFTDDAPVGDYSAEVELTDGTTVSTDTLEFQIVDLTGIAVTED